MQKPLNWLMIILFLISEITLGCALVAVADEISFRCKVKNEYKLTDDGQLVKPEKLRYTEMTFSVERSTGRIFGGVFNNQESISSKQSDYYMKVIDSGSQGSFKVLSFAEKRGVAESLAIRTKQEGNQKAFVGIDYLQTVVTGTCE